MSDVYAENHQSDPAPKLHCCFVGCGADADVEIRHGPKVDDYTHACIDHVGDLLTSADQHTVTWLHPIPATSPVAE